MRREAMMTALAVGLMIGGCSDDETAPAAGGTSAGGAAGTGGAPGGTGGDGGTAAGSGGGGGGSAPEPIEPYDDNPFYWQFDGQPVLLLGSSSDDNLFQTAGSALTDELDALVGATGNYVRNTMSSRDDEGHEVQPFHFDDGQGLFDLDEWNDEYWDRFSAFLSETASRGVFVEIEVWATWDFYQARWQANPWNPANNSSYTAADTILEEDWPHPAYERTNPFFETVPLLQDDATVLGYQQAFVDQLLSYALDYPHVLYTMDNETSADPEWFRYWIDYIAAQASAAGRVVYTTEMLDEWDPTDPIYDELYGDPNRYTFVEVSQNNHASDETHYTRGLAARNRVLDSGASRPLNNTKIYGADSDPWGYGDHEGLERFWRNLFAGHASARFHRPDAGLGASSLSYDHIASARDLLTRLDVFHAEPDNSLLAQRQSNEAFCLARPGQAYAVVFFEDGTVTLDLTDVPVGQTLTVTWLELDSGLWEPPQTLTADGSPLELQTPTDDFWAVLVATTD